MFSVTWEQLPLATAIVVITVLSYRLWQAEQRVKELRDALPPFLSNASDRSPRRRSSSRFSLRSPKKVTIFLDGAFDLTHYGHMNAFRQARALGTHLIVGLNSDESITRCKGRPILNDEERYEVINACRFVDNIIRDVPYVMTEEYILELMEKYDIDYVVHGDDPCTVDGKDVYALVKASGKFLCIPRTEGVSTTDLVGRIMTLTENVLAPDDDVERTSSSTLLSSKENSRLHASARTFFPTSRMMRCFAGAMSNAPPKATNVVVYIAGHWDMFNASHVDILKKAREFGDYVLVGVHSDDTVREHTVGRPPVLNLYERVLAVLACKYVDDVLLSPEIIITKEMIQSFRINKVAKIAGDTDIPDVAYKAPKELGILETLVPSRPRMTLETIARRILQNWDAVVAKQMTKAKKEKNFYDQKYEKA
eukprot:GEMP01004661.1.p1 GENE.GEMP01004661.1~~GEMP01004661.1.p1  ORF type:complete len:423 (+),score=103.46 GEMP01004661.1:1957-3225(+)